MYRDPYLHYVLYSLNRWNKITRENLAVLQLIFSPFLSFSYTYTQLNIPLQRYLPKRPYARPRNGRAINYITAFSQVRKSRSSRSSQINRAVANERHNVKRSAGRFALLINSAAIINQFRLSAKSASVAGRFCLLAWLPLSIDLSRPLRSALIHRSLRPPDRYTHDSSHRLDFPSSFRMVDIYFAFDTRHQILMPRRYFTHIHVCVHISMRSLRKIVRSTSAD